MNKEPRLENWYVGQDDCLFGDVYNHPKGFPDGSPVRTSRIVWIDELSGQAKTKNTNYILGKPKDENQT